MGQLVRRCPGLLHSQQDRVSTMSGGEGVTCGEPKVGEAEGAGEGVNTGSGGQTISDARAPSLQFWLGAIGDGVLTRHIVSCARAACSRSYGGLEGRVMGWPSLSKSGMGGS